MGGFVIWDRKAKGGIGVPNYTLRAKAGDKCLGYATPSI